LHFELFVTLYSEQKSFDERGLADPRLACDKHDLPFATHGLCKQPVKVGKFGISSY